MKSKELNHPILGDSKYKGQKGKRLYLHATELEIRNPLTGKILSFEAKFPRDFLKQL